MKTVTVKLQAAIAKRLINYEGRCARLHGYGHVIETTFTSNSKEDVLMDFNEIKNNLGKWLDDNWDHNVILNKDDKPLGNLIEDMTGQTVFYLEGDPTSENMAEYIKEEVCPEMFPDAKCISVRVYDTENEYAEIS